MDGPLQAGFRAGTDAAFAADLPAATDGGLDRAGSGASMPARQRRIAQVRWIASDGSAADGTARIAQAPMGSHLTQSGRQEARILQRIVPAPTGCHGYRSCMAARPTARAPMWPQLTAPRLTDIRPQAAAFAAPTGGAGYRRSRKGTPSPVCGERSRGCVDGRGGGTLLHWNGTRLDRTW